VRWTDQIPGINLFANQPPLLIQLTDASMHAKNTGKLAFGICLFLSLPLPLSAQTNAATEQRPEEITITGVKSIRALEQQIWTAEDHLFGLLNELNDDHHYDIHCEKEFRTGSLVPKRVCKPNFLHESTSQNAQATIADMRGEGAVRGAPVQSELEFRYPQLKAKMQELAGKHPELQKGFADYYQLREELNKRLASGAEDSPPP
jgi:hypothetical protein